MSGASPRAVDGEEAQAGGGDAVKLAIGVCHQFVALLGGGIEAHRCVGLVGFGIRHLLVQAIDAAGTGIYQVLHRMMAAALQQRQESHQVGLGVGKGVLYGISDAGLYPPG